VTAIAKSAFVNSCMAHAESEREEIEKEISKGVEQISQLSAQLRSASRSLHVARRRLLAFKTILATERAQLERDFDQLELLPHVQGVEVDGPAIRVLTDEIIIKHEGQRYKIGRFALELDLKQGLRVVNLKNKGDKSAWDHPHVQASLPCLGNLRDGFEKLLGECQIVPLVSMLVQFLDSYNPETAYCPIEHWEKV
jgi:hypothetical protein